MLESIDRYRIEEEIGKGAMANVYRAFDPHINRTLAVKVLRSERCISDHHRSRFLRESRTAGNLSHPNIVTIYDVGEDQGQPYIAMELLKGVPLDQLIKSGHRFNVKQVLEIAIQLAVSLEYAHGQGVVHRDIKPSNIVCFQDGTDLHIKITDFGIAHVEDTELSQQTQEGDLLGTPQYMSPEQVLGQPVDHRSDMFSLGVILYQLLSGKKPFRGDSIATIMFRIATEEAPPMDNAAGEIPPPLHNLVHRLLQKQPSKRPATTAELVESLRLIYQGLDKRQLDDSGVSLHPLRWKWTLIMAIAITSTAFLGGWFMHHQQRQMAQEQLIKFGDTLGKFIATEMADHLLGQDWVAIEILSQEFAAKGGFSHLAVVDHEGIVRGAGNPASTGVRFDDDVYSLLPLDASGNLSGRSYINGTDGFHFVRPVRFQNMEIGKVYLTLAAEPLDTLSQQMISMLLTFTCVVLLIALVTTYVLGSSISRPIHTLNNALQNMARGTYPHPIKQTRNDEFGLLISSFNSLLDRLKKGKN